MSNTTLNASIIAKAAVKILDNELVMARQVFRGYEPEFDKKVNGYEVGDTITVRKPADFTVRKTMTASAQDVKEGKLNVVINNVSGCDFKFTSQQLTLNISQLAERVIKPAMVQVANSIDQDLMALYKGVNNWVGTPGNTISTFAGFAKGPTRMDLTAVPQGDRSAVLSPTDYWAMAGGQTALYQQMLVKDAYRKAKLGMIGDVDTYQAQNIPTHTVGPLGGTPLVNGATQETTYDTTGVNTQSLITDGWTAAAAARVKNGDVFTLANVYDVNPVTKAKLPHLKQFVCMADGSSDGSGNLTLTIAPQIIVGGAFATVDSSPADNAALTFVGTAGTGYAQNLMFHKNAFALTMVPLVRPPGAVDCSRQTYKGISVRVIPFYDGVNDVSQWRLDCIYAATVVDRRLAVRTSGT